MNSLPFSGKTKTVAAVALLHAAVAGFLLLKTAPNEPAGTVSVSLGSPEGASGAPAGRNASSADTPAKLIRRQTAAAGDTGTVTRVSFQPGVTSGELAGNGKTSGSGKGTGAGTGNGDIPVFRTKPPYPNASRRLGESGTVTVKISVNGNGTVASSAVSVSSGYPRLDESAKKAVLKWRFPAGYARTVYQPVKFSLTD